MARSIVPVSSIADAGFLKATAVAPGSLESGSLLARHLGAVRVSLFPTAGEATATYLPTDWRGRGSPREQSDSDRQRHAKANARRASNHVRRYIRANAMPFMWTLTYAIAAVDRAAVVADLQRFFRRLREQLHRIPVVAVIERGRRGTLRLHVHLALPVFVPVETMRRLWPHGHVWVGDPGKLSGKVDARTLAAYLSKYVGKQFSAEDGQAEPDRLNGRHRYLCAQGWAPERKQRRFWTVDHAIRWLETNYGPCDRAYGWESDRLPPMHGACLYYPDSVIAAWLNPP